MDADLKIAVDTNCGDSWNGKSVEDALISIKEIIKNTSNSAVHRKMFDEMIQKSSESVREFITRLKACAIDCEYTCPFDENHDLTEITTSSIEFAVVLLISSFNRNCCKKLIQ